MGLVPQKFENIFRSAMLETCERISTSSMLKKEIMKGSRTDAEVEIETSKPSHEKSSSCI